MAKEQKLVPVFMPALVALLLRAEESKGEPLTEQEVIAIRDEANCVMMPAAQAKKQEESRGYPDVDPENCWGHSIGAFRRAPAARKRSWRRRGRLPSVSIAS